MQSDWGAGQVEGRRRPLPGGGTFEQDPKRVGWGQCAQLRQVRFRQRAQRLQSPEAQICLARATIGKKALGPGRSEPGRWKEADRVRGGKVGVEEVL